MSLETDHIEIAGLPPETLQALEERAQQIGTSRESYVRHLIQKDLSAPLSLRDLYAPVREQIAESSISEEELDALLEEAREEAWQERQGKVQK